MSIYRSDMEEGLADAIAFALKIPRAEIDAFVLKRREEARRRMAQHAARWKAWLSHVTDVQAVLIDAAEREGHRVIRLLRDRHTGHVAVMMQKDRVWNDAKGKMGAKLLIVYPDGVRTTTMERTISIKKSF